ncbi:MAG: hypothetical protein ACRCYY_12870 [Trueperaceae bacterium]
MAEKGKITVRIAREIETDLAHWAKLEGKSVSAMAAELIADGIKMRGKSQGLTTLIPEIRSLIHDEFTGLSNRIGSLFTRTYLEAATSRQLILGSAIFTGMSADEVDAIDAEAYASSVKSLEKKSDELKALTERVRRGLL